MYRTNVKERQKTGQVRRRSLLSFLSFYIKFSNLRLHRKKMTGDRLFGVSAKRCFSILSRFRVSLTHDSRRSSIERGELQRATVERLRNDAPAIWWCSANKASANSRGIADVKLSKYPIAQAPAMQPPTCHHRSFLALSTPVSLAALVTVMRAGSCRKCYVNCITPSQLKTDRA